jgi:hypothetical protein
MIITSENKDLDSGHWKHPLDSDLLFAYIKESDDSKFEKKINAAYNTALKLFKKIQCEVQKETGKPVKNGVYLLSTSAMVKILNDISGMAQTSVNQKTFTEKGTSSVITVDFFQSLLDNLGGNVELIGKYLSTELLAIQAQVRRLSKNTKFGTLIAIVDGIEAFDTVTISFSFITLSTQKSVKSFISLRCKSIDKMKLNLDYTITRFTYNTP